MTAKPAKKEPANARIDALEQGQAEIAGKLSEAIEGINKLAEVVTTISRNAKDNPVVLNRHTEAEEQFLGGPTQAEVVEKNGVQMIEQTSVANLDSKVDQEKLRNIAFMEEMVMVDIHTSSNQFDDQVFEISVNGESVIFKRGERKAVPRKFVEGLARAKPIGYSSQEFRDEAGLTQIRYPTHIGVRYPFSLVNASPRDTAWLQHVLGQP